MGSTSLVVTNQNVKGVEKNTAKCISRSYNVCDRITGLTFSGLGPVRRAMGNRTRKIIRKKHHPTQIQNSKF